ncbi:MAG: magnesium transporter [Candidatus Hadarchaeota archaeon]
MPKNGIHSIVTQGLSVMVICTVIELAAGGFLSGMDDYFTTVLPGLIIMVPPLLGLRGNIGGALASRLGTGLNAGLIRPRLRWSKEIKANIISSILISFLAAASIGFISYGANLLTGSLTIGLQSLLFIAIIAGTLSGLILSLLTTVVSVFTYVHGWDPDNVTAPMMATIGDFTMIASIYLAVVLVR